MIRYQTKVYEWEAEQKRQATEKTERAELARLQKKYPGVVQSE